MGILNVNLKKTNVDRLIGREVYAETDIDSRKGGVVTVLGQLWHCKPLNRKETISEGELVRIVKLEGVTFYVEKVVEEVEK